MYSKQEIQQIKKQFWTSFGHYMRPVKNASGEEINWVNYKTGVRNIYFRMDASRSNASVSIELRNEDEQLRLRYYKQLQVLKNFMQEVLQEEWEWSEELKDEDGRTISRISKTLAKVNIYERSDWPAIISFLKQRIVALDDFWNNVKDGFIS
jgi:hypothetical protein